MKKVFKSLLIIGCLSLLVNAKTNYGSVNGDEINDLDIKIAINNPQVQFETLEEKVQKDIINKIIETKLLTQYALKSDIKKSKEYKETIVKLEEDLALKLWMQKQITTIKITEKEQKEFYNNNKDKFTQNKVYNASHILLENEKDAKEIITKLSKVKDTKKEFTKLAKEKSIGPSAKNGGELGWFEPEKMLPEFSQAVSKLKKGNITKNAVKTQYGYHVIYLDDKKENGTATFKDAKIKIEQIMTQNKMVEKINDKIKELKKDSKIILN